MTMPAGTYYIGDLCYVFDDNEWDEVLSHIIKGNSCVNGEFTLADGRKFASYTTKWGDGEYYDQYSNGYPVDAGLIGCVKLKDVSKESISVNNLGNVFIFDTDFETSGEDGIIKFSHVTIDTAAEYSYEDE